MEGTGLVADMSPSDQVIKFCLENNLQRGVIDELLDRGFDSLQALSLVDAEDLKSQRIPVGQRRLIIHIAKSLSSTVDQQKSQSSSSAVPTPEINTAQTPDVYQQTLMNSLLIQQAQLATGQSDVAQNLLNQPPVLLLTIYQDTLSHHGRTHKSIYPRQLVSQPLHTLIFVTSFPMRLKKN